MTKDAGPQAGRDEDRLKDVVEGTHRPSAPVDPDQVTFQWVVHTVTGDRGREVRAAQARAIKEFLTWLDTQQRDTS